MPRYKLILEYDGKDFVGWQRQANGFAVQQAIEDAIRAFSGQAVTLFGAGRTDSGVHALGQVAHFDLTREFPAAKVQDAINFYLRPNAVTVLDAQAVSENFDARFSATARYYLYRIADQRPPLALRRGRAWHTRGPLDVAAMHTAAQGLLGEHDFTTFRAVQCQAKSPVRTLDVLDVERREGEIHIRAKARSYLHHQIRSIVGSLNLVGLGKWTAKDLVDALVACDRTRCGPVAPAEGLYLTAVNYPEAV
ncbi:MAG: tRNA pseudouridine(38-40) synthase TruA [Rhodospirillaceae bacterium]|jgi:tRNA pseudouridine38-40 synthase|nr:tRNA pseudouridine(38-40) synthase TruA [Rhodospirillaceae bacterium]MBT4490827.1 tRNA pseudouridine(38-40) synthase TruA [Rhodospirillaceae bacterium]MBT5192132.1 tRNA pseudouridine(38-40) synthase TruA [Rhodospirillaceae bacterium]MBT5894939.1 tRNA pseudouridine(38-40) synthase TruA [Rhodospirillaceae bacterium]MBT6428448.1 tRNA pseudouridine(38-40) synthase TruA [Rhodospirillaceae bacterium]